LILLYTTSASAISKLLMYHNPYCSYCVKFIKEVAIDFKHDKVDLRIVVRNEEPFWFTMAINENRIKPIRGTPTFILWDGENEIARLVGYSSKESFYNRLDEILKWRM